MGKLFDVAQGTYIERLLQRRQARMTTHRICADEALVLASVCRRKHSICDEDND